MYGCIDRFEGDLAVILIDDYDCAIDLPRILLPPDINEGDYVKINIEYDADKTKAAYDEAWELFNK